MINMFMFLNKEIPFTEELKIKDQKAKNCFLGKKTLKIL